MAKKDKTITTPVVTTVEKNKSGGITTVSASKHTLTVRASKFNVKEILEILESSSIENTQLKFDGDDFLELPKEIVERLGTYEKQSYHMEKGYARALAKTLAASKKPNIVVKQKGPLRMLGSDSTAQIEKIQRKIPKGLHMTLQSPDEVEEFKDQGYKQVEGAHIKHNGLIDVVAMTISEERFQEHLQAVSQKSTDRAKGVSRDFKGEVEQQGHKVIDESSIGYVKK